MDRTKRAFKTIRSSLSPDTEPNLSESLKSHSFDLFPLHDAAQHGRLDLLRKLITEEGVDFFEQDGRGRSVLHCATLFEHQDISLEMISFILSAISDSSKRQALVNLTDHRGETCLHIAAKHEHAKVIQKLILESADVNKKSHKGEEPIMIIYAKIPSSLIPIFDSAVKLEGGALADEHYDVAFDFTPVIGYNSEVEESSPVSPIESYLLFHALKSSDQKCKDVLLHPLVKMFLYLKWIRLRYLLYVSMTFHVFWLLAYTAFLLEVYLYYCPYSWPEEDGPENPQNQTNQNNFPYSIPLLNSLPTKCPSSILYPPIFSISTLVLSSLVVLKEAFQITNSPTLSYYFSRFENLGQFLLLINILFTTAYPVFIQERDEDGNVVFQTWQYELSALGIFLTWILVLVQIGKTPKLGLYVEILLRVLQSFYFFIVTFISLLIAFALAFSIVMPRSGRFAFWPLALSKVLVMMVGELNYDQTFFQDGRSLPSFITSHVLFVCFTLMVTIILFNLLIGLTVSDIHSLRTGANGSLLKMQLQQIYFFETFLFSRLMTYGFKGCSLQERMARIFSVTDKGLEVVLPIHKIPPEWKAEIRELLVKNLHRKLEPDVEKCSPLSLIEERLDAFMKEMRGFMEEVKLQLLEDQQDQEGDMKN